MAHIVVCWTVCSAKIIRVLWSHGKGVSVPIRKCSHAAIGHHVESVAISVVGLKQALAPATEPMLERKHHSMVVGNAFCIPFRHSAESRVGRAVRNRVIASPRW